MMMIMCVCLYTSVIPGLRLMTGSVVVVVVSSLVIKLFSHFGSVKSPGIRDTLIMKQSKISNRKGIQQ